MILPQWRWEKLLGTPNEGWHLTLAPAWLSRMEGYRHLLRLALFLEKGFQPFTVSWRTEPNGIFRYHQMMLPMPLAVVLRKFRDYQERCIPGRDRKGRFKRNRGFPFWEL